MKKIASVFCFIFAIVFVGSSMVYASTNTGIKYKFPYKSACDEYYGPIKPWNVPPTGEKYHSYPHMIPYDNKLNNIQNFYHSNSEKVLEKGWHSDSRGKYYCKGDGSIFKNCWVWIDGKYYKFDYNGYVYRNQWIKDNYTGSWYFVDTDGAVVTGWKYIDNVWYYFNPEMGSLYGVMARNTVMYINDYTFGCGYFAFNKDGAIITNSWYGGHYYGNNGVRID